MGTQYVVDENGKHVSVILPIEEYERLIEALEDLEDARAADEIRATVASGDDEFILYEQAREEIGKSRTTSQ
jgi:PHD/YefM family antitoxin component YafN of YafNO toxin-antitoxin module